MFNIYIEQMIARPIEEVFELLADHGAYSTFRGIKRSKLLEQGQSEKNGLGALRYLDLGIVNFDERITCFERPHRLDYKIERSAPLPFNHQLGSIKLEDADGHTKVTWVSKGTITIPLLGKLYFDKKFQTQGEKGFSSLLKQIERAESQ
ncbi:SRPBCC family protein [Oceanicoccus sagamiensis]|uniref:MxaD family protein n=1 Tax=Oceanicoccus sagamiensis TaxID=716816 RepID=A0A1X9NFM4_9GAMM|nr:SRPBCC family protein [Oceanicoccus sagamiensis]ARN75222.1 MxaD family protein [Oceanicoccus sagamiensis]